MNSFPFHTRLCPFFICIFFSVQSHSEYKCNEGKGRGMQSQLEAQLCLVQHQHVECWDQLITDSLCSLSLNICMRLCLFRGKKAELRWEQSQFSGSAPATLPGWLGDTAAGERKRSLPLYVLLFPLASCLCVQCLTALVCTSDTLAAFNEETNRYDLCTRNTVCTITEPPAQ